jgi:lysophospholipase L1-like esterase
MKELYEKPTLVPPYDTAQKDKKLGWKMTPGYSYTGKMKNQDWSEYDISIHYDKNGFKVFGDTTSTLPKILFLGDSYTACIEVSNEKSFYSLLKDSLPAEVFAYGHAGFGTLQEYLVLDEWVDRIKPDVVVWEVCSNDFIDNYARLEIECGYKVGERRPYLAPDGDIYYRQPLSLWQRMKEHLFFFSWLEERWVLLVQRFFDVEKKVGEHFIAVDKRQYKTFDKAVLTTEKIVGMIRHRLPAACQLLAFSADIFQPQMEEFKRIFESYGAVFLEAPAREVERISLEQKVMTKAIDGYHWNEKGHQIVASELLPHLRKLTNREASRQKPGGK